MKRLKRREFLAISSLACWCAAAQPPRRVQASDYREFWIWDKPASLAALAQASTLYFLQGEVRANSRHHPATLTRQGTGVLDFPGKSLWLVYRTTSLDWDQTVMAQIVARLQDWQRMGNQVVGLQVDFDAPSAELEKYRQFLQSIRQQLPGQYALSATGLLDWSVNGGSDLRALGETVDELVIQTYQGRTTLPNLQRYRPRLSALPFRFKIGLMENAIWPQALEGVADNPNFSGYVVFLVA